MAMLRSTSSKGFSALRAISSPRKFSRSITHEFTSFHEVSLPLHHLFSTDTNRLIDDKLAKTIPEEPANFPLSIEYNCCGERATLKRELNGVFVATDDESDVSDDDSESRDEYNCCGERATLKRELNGVFVATDDESDVSDEYNCCGEGATLKRELNGVFVATDDESDVSDDDSESSDESSSSDSNAEEEEEGLLKRVKKFVKE